MKDRMKSSIEQSPHDCVKVAALQHTLSKLLHCSNSTIRIQGTSGILQSNSCYYLWKHNLQQLAWLCNALTDYCYPLTN